MISLGRQCIADFQGEYAAGWNVHTRPYPGIIELLQSLQHRGLKLAVLSNKPDAFTKLCVRHYLAAFAFEVVLGQREHVPRKPHPAGAREAAETLGLNVEEILYVGDTAIDMQTARSAGMYPVGVTWGFRPREELAQSGAAAIIDQPQQLLELLDRPCS